MYQLEFGK